MPEIKKAYVTLMVADLDKSVEFYNGLLNGTTGRVFVLYSGI